MTFQTAKKTLLATVNNIIIINKVQYESTIEYAELN